MKLGLQGTPVTDADGEETGNTFVRSRSWFRSWLTYCEVLPILLVASVLRFYMINLTEFDGDQATIFSMAYNAVSHGSFVATSNVASIGIVNPPAIVYILMLPAAFSANPVWGAVLTAFLATLSVLLTYFFVRRYYGRLAATIATLLYATAALPVFYSRFMWQQNLLLFFVPLYILLLFRGAVARRQGWFGLALFLLGLLVQLHGSALLLAVPLLIALIVAPNTIRWRDVILGLLLLALSYAPYILWEASVRFHDVSILFNTTGRPSKFDSWALLLYQFLLSPYNVLSISSHSLLFPFVPLLIGIRWVVTALVISSALLALGMILGLRTIHTPMVKSRNVFKRMWCWWRNLCASPDRCGLSILLSWQIVPLLALLRHSITLYPHYFIMFMPGPFILIGFFVAKIVIWLRPRRVWTVIGRCMLLSLIAVIVGVQTIGSAVSVLDLTDGKFIDATHTLASAYYNDLDSLQRALSTTDQIAQKRHLRHIYVDADDATIDAFRYLSAQMHTPTTVFSDSCALLPSLAHGPVILLVGAAHSSLTESLLPRFATTSPIATSVRLGGPPFRIYVLSSVHQSSSVEDTLTPNLQLVDTQSFTFQNAPFLLTRWRFLLSQPSTDSALYSYNMVPITNATSIASQQVNRKERIAHRSLINGAKTAKCALTSIQAGDQLLVGFRLPSEQYTPLNLRVLTSTTKNEDLALRLHAFTFAFETYRPLRSTQQTLLSSTGNNFVSIPISSMSNKR